DVTNILVQFQVERGRGGLTHAITSFVGPLGGGWPLRVTNGNSRVFRVQRAPTNSCPTQRPGAGAHGTDPRSCGALRSMLAVFLQEGVHVVLVHAGESARGQSRH